MDVISEISIRFCNRHATIKTNECLSTRCFTNEMGHDEEASQRKNYRNSCNGVNVSKPVKLVGYWKQI